MTVSSELNRKQYTGNGSTTSFATSPVVFFDTSDLVVYVVTTATGASTTLTENTHYTVSGGDGSTGTVNLAAGSDPYGAPSSAQTVVIVRDVPLTQASDFVQNDASDAEVVEDALDKLTMAAQQLNTRLDRSFTLADSDVSGASLTVPTPSAGTLLGWNDDADGLENYTPTELDLALVSAFVETLIDDSDADEFVATIIAGQTAETSPASGDIISIVDVSLTPDDGRKMTLGNVLKVVNDITEDTSPDSAADYALTYDASASAAKKVLLGDISNGAYRSMQIFTANGTWTKPSGLKRVKVTVVGGGGAGGGAAITGAATCSVGGGGGGGGASIKTIAAASLGSTETVTVGAGGAANNGAAGSAGGASSFGSHCSATGGAGGGIGSTSTYSYVVGGTGGIGSSGDVNVAGNAGGPGLHAQTVWGAAGVGGGSIFCGAASPTAAGGQSPVAGRAYGGGGSGGEHDINQGSAEPGGAGAAGIVLVEEFF